MACLGQGGVDPVRMVGEGMVPVSVLIGSWIDSLKVDADQAIVDLGSETSFSDAPHASRVELSPSRMAYCRI